MVRFIFVCMAIVALSGISILAQGITGDISNVRTQVADRNQPAEDTVVAFIAEEQEPAEEFFSPDQLNEIETAAGWDDSNDNFGMAFTDEAPKALAEPLDIPFDSIEPSAH